MNKKITGYWEKYLYNRHRQTSLFNCYGTCSSTKQAVWHDIVGLCKKEEGKDLCVLTFNGFFFTAGFVNKDNFYIITPEKDYVIPLTEEMKADLII